MSYRRTRAQPISIELAVTNADYYAEVHRKLTGDARTAFERAVDEAWRALHAQAPAPRYR